MNELELEDDNEAAESRIHELDELGRRLEEKKDEAVAWKGNYETRIAEARRQYSEGYTRLNDTKAGHDPLKQPEYRRAVDNITKSRVIKAAARTGDTLFPTNESNYAIKPSASSTENPALEGMDEATASDFLDAAAEEMEKEVKDSLDECGYTGIGRMAVFEGYKVGTAVIHGPCPKKVMRKSVRTIQTPNGPFSQMVNTEVTVPWTELIDVDEFFPQASKNMKECGHVFHLKMMTKKQMAELKEQGFDPEQVDRLLKMDPDPGTLLNRPSMQGNPGLEAIMKDRYPMWKYTGPVDAECLCHLGVQTKEGEDEVEGVVWFCQGVTLKAALNELGGLPYHVWCGEDDDESIFGRGIPHQCANDQFDANLSWGTIKKNAIESASPVYGILKGTYESEHGDKEMPPKNRTLILKSDLPLDQVFQTKLIPSNIQDLMLVYNQAKQNADEHTLMQTLEEGAPSNVQVGQAVLAMIQQGNNIVQRFAAKSWDDNITLPLIGMYVKFEILYGENEKAKGAFDVVPKASAQFLERDVKAQNLMQLLQIADNPTNASMFKRREIIEDLVQVMDAPASKYMTTKKEQETIEQQQAQQPNPEMLKIEMQKEIESIKAANQLEIAKIKANTDLMVAEASLEAASITAASDEVMTTQERESRVRIAELSARLKAQGEILKDQREREKTAASTTLEAQKLASKEAGDALEVQVEKTPRLA